MKKDNNGLIEVLKDSSVEVGRVLDVTYQKNIKKYGGIIVGWRINNIKGNACNYHFKENPLLNQEIKIIFENKVISPGIVDIEIFYMKFLD